MVDGTKFKPYINLGVTTPAKPVGYKENEMNKELVKFTQEEV